MARNAKKIDNNSNGYHLTAVRLPVELFNRAIDQVEYFKKTRKGPRSLAHMTEIALREYIDREESARYGSISGDIDLSAGDGFGTYKLPGER